MSMQIDQERIFEMKMENVFPASFTLTPEELVIKRYAEEVRTDKCAVAEKWAIKMVDGLVEAAGGGESRYNAYFMLEDEFHREAHKLFAEKLGISTDHYGMDEERLFEIGDLTFSRQAFFFDEANPDRVSAISYVAIPTSNLE